MNLTREDFGFTKLHKLYGCLQTPFKIHPDFDKVMDQITREDPNATILFIDSHLTYALRERWKASGLKFLLNKSVFLPSMEANKFMNLMNICDILLDPLYFGSGNTFYESAYCGVPQVSLPGNFMRGRMVYAGYKKIGLLDTPLAPKYELYAKTAIDWANTLTDLMNLGCKQITGAGKLV